jgi:glycolate oxidase FAD binding subunit
MPDRTRTVLIFGCSLEQAGAAMARALQSPHEVSGAAHLPADAAAQSRVGFVSKAAEAVTAIRIEGTGISVDYRCEMLLKELSEFGETEELHTANSQSLWAELRDVLPFAGSDDARAVWRISVPPAEGPRLAATLVDATDGHVYLDWGGGLIWLAVEEGSDAHAQTVREKISPSVGHATLIRASEAVRSKVSVFPKPAWIALSHRVKEGFDPKSILNPGRLVEGI